MNIEEAGKIIKQFYPDYLKIDDLDNNYSKTPEYEKLSSLCKRAELEMPHWKKICDALRNVLLKELQISDWTHLFRNDPCYRLRISYPSIAEHPNRIRELMLHVSVLTNHYAIYFSENDYDPVTKTYSFPLIGFRNSLADEYLLYREYEGDKNQTEKFIYAGQNLDPIIFSEIENTLSKNYPGIKPFPQDLIFRITPGLTNGNILPGETTYFHCLFTDHIF